VADENLGAIPIAPTRLTLVWVVPHRSSRTTIAGQVGRAAKPHPNLDASRVTECPLMEATVVIPTFNRKSALVRCLLNVPGETPTIVVDDGSTDGTREAVLRLKRQNVRYVRQDNAGPAAARNTGVGLAKTDAVAFTDSDCIPAAGWLAALLEHLASAPERVAGVGGRVLADGDGWVGRYATFHRLLDPPPSCSYLVTANCCYRRLVVLEAGGFDSTIRHPGGEDPGLSLNVRRLGYRLEYEPRAVVYHDYRENVFDFARTFFRYGEGCAIVMGK
jgi:mycofactocin glycosyltransferase